MNVFRKLTYALLAALVVAMGASTAYSHSGGLNASGCHAGSKPYHCHRAPSEMVRTQDGRNRLRCDLGSRSVECVGRTPTVAPVPSHIQTWISVPEAYRRIMNVAEGQPYTQAVNVVFFNGLTVRFAEEYGFAALRFEGTNRPLFELIQQAVR